MASDGSLWRGDEDFTAAFFRVLLGFPWFRLAMIQWDRTPHFSPRGQLSARWLPSAMQHNLSRRLIAGDAWESAGSTARPISERFKNAVTQLIGRRWPKSTAGPEQFKGANGVYMLFCAETYCVRCGQQCPGAIYGMH